MTIEQINALTVEDVLEILISRLYPDGWVAPEPAEGEEPAEHPPIEELEAELEIYKAELIAEEEARLAELARIQDLNDRYSVFEDFGLLQSALSISNPAAYFRDEILKNSDKEQAETNMVAIESAYTTAKEAQVVAITKQQRIEKGRKARLTCENVMDLISGFNLDRELTIEQITTLQQTFANIESALKSGRPTFAKQMITALEPDGELVTQEMKDEALSLLSEY